MADIRRSVQAPTPNTFTYQPVVDTSIADTVGKLVKVGIGLDAELAKERLDEAQKMLNAQYVVGSPAAGALLEDSMSDTVKLSPEDSRALRDFQGVLDTNQLGQEQGRMNYQTYQLRAERLTRIAIAKRPGLAAEFRQIAAGYVGSDVIGAESRYLADMENQMGQNAASAAKAQQDAIEEAHKRRITAFAQYDPNVLQFSSMQDADKYMADNWDGFMAFSRVQTEAETAKAGMGIYQAKETASQGMRDSQWIGEASAGLTHLANAGTTIKTALDQTGMAGDPNAVRQGIQALMNNAQAELARLEQAAAENRISEATVARYRTMFDRQMEYLEGVMNGADDKAVVENFYNSGKIMRQQVFMNDEEFAKLSAFMDLLPPESRALLAPTMEPELKIIAGRLLVDATMPAGSTQRYPDVVRSLVPATINKNGTVNPVNMDAFTQLVGKMLIGFTTEDDEALRIVDFTRDPRTNRKGVVGVLFDNRERFARSMSDEQKNEMVQLVGMAYTNVARRGLAELYTDPALREAITLNINFDNGQAFEFRPGFSEANLSPGQIKRLKDMNAALAPKMVADTLAAYSGLELPEVSKRAWQLRSEAKALRSAQEARRGAGSGGSSASPARAVKGTGEFSGFTLEPVGD